MVYVFQYSFKILGKEKRKPNPFFLYRKNYMKTAPKNIKMTELSKMASESWKKLPEDEKANWRRLYEVNRDLLPNTSDKKDLVETAAIVDNDAAVINHPIVKDDGS